MMRKTPNGARGTRIHVLCQYRAWVFQRDLAPMRYRRSGASGHKTRDAVREYQLQWFTRSSCLGRFQLWAPGKTRRHRSLRERQL
ncbi:hypothetical protein PpBr36_01417 [Pyricularia pennisetigena]|uniref:hypothetical protein n=1 Tax=Pyricularia pennisetigena TaxID=1578925 RepID=UPI001151E5CD|nr:hypothetical protein PpBr36_01417 [Pyricularia pennisetigena]TLS28610.1 hypothetical protein PpBr36_01417 [Pyricularia pennisetigena]